MFDLEGERREEEPEDQACVWGVTHEHLQTGEIGQTLLFLRANRNWRERERERERGEELGGDHDRDTMNNSLHFCDHKGSFMHIVSIPTHLLCIPDTTLCWESTYAEDAWRQTHGVC